MRILIESQKLSLNLSRTPSPLKPSMNDEPMKFSCPCCDHDGEFTSGKIPFVVFSLLDVGRERRRAKRTYVCPKCGTQILLPKNAVSDSSRPKDGA